MAFYQFKRTQKIHKPLKEMWSFISDPNNLKHITPDYMDFEITSKNLPSNMYAGMIIAYRVAPIFGIKIKWVTEITHLKENSYFVDEQRLGPYKIWHHQHILEPNGNGTIMTDIISYGLPFGILGAIANRLFIQRKLKDIFDFRAKIISELS